MKHLTIVFMFGVLFHPGLKIWSQESFHSKNNQEFKIMFYNVENLFDTFDDSLTRDNEFLPEGSYHWNDYKFYKKINHIYKVITAAGEWHIPDVIGLAEIENRYVLEKLVDDTPLSKFHYKIIHENSPDRRGIDVALLYREENFKLISYRYHRIRFPKNPDVRTRDLLHVSGVSKGDTLHFFINHWPSRWGGTAASEHKRVHVASVLKMLVDSLQLVHNHPNIVISGDFNDEPDNQSIQTTLGAKPCPDEWKPHELYNLSVLPCKQKLGTLKYRDEWNCFDQMIVSGALLDDTGWRVNGGQMHIFKSDFLLMEDDRYGGKKLFRTYLGRKYQGGFSDHLPVLITLTK